MRSPYRPGNIGTASAERHLCTPSARIAASTALVGCQPLQASSNQVWEVHRPSRSFPSDEALTKLSYLALRNINQK